MKRIDFLTGALMLFQYPISQNYSLPEGNIRLIRRRRFLVKIILSVLLFYIPISGSVQNWKPLNPTEKYNFSINSVTPQSTVWVESTQVEDNDSIYFLNKIAFYCDYCGGYMDLFLMNQPSFLLSDIRFFDDGTYRLSDSENNLYIQPYAGLNESWIFDSINSIMAEIVYVGDTNIFDEVDSIKRINLTGSKEIIISKNHGLLKYPLFNPQNHHVLLLGIEGRDLGFITPNFDDFFTFDVGDVFEYYNKWTYHPYMTEEYQKYTITEKQVLGNGYSFTINAKAIIYYSPPYRWDTSYYYNHTETFNYYNAPDHFLNAKLHELVNYPGAVWNGYNCFWSILEYTTKFAQSKFAKVKPGVHLKYWSGDTLYADYNYNDCSVNESFIFLEGLGLYYHSHSYPDLMYTESDTRTLRGCIVDGETYGVLTPDSLFAPFPTKIPASNLGNEIIIFPNPFSDVLKLKITIPETSELTFTLTNLLGKEVHHQKSVDKYTVINLAHLENGFYFVEISDPHRSIIKKVLKVN